MTSKYAEDTKVSVDQSRREIEAILKRFGAEGFMYADEGDSRLVSFKYEGRVIRFLLNLPPLDQFRTYQRRYSKYNVQTVPRTPAQTRTAWEAEERRLWRSLANAIKSKLDTVQSGIMSFEEEFLAYTVTPTGQTIGEVLLPQLDHALASGQMPALMPGVEH